MVNKDQQLSSIKIKWWGLRYSQPENHLPPASRITSINTSIHQSIHQYINKNMRSMHLTKENQNRSVMYGRASAREIHSPIC